MKSDPPHNHDRTTGKGAACAECTACNKLKYLNGVCLVCYYSTKHIKRADQEARQYYCLPSTSSGIRMVRNWI